MFKKFDVKITWVKKFNLTITGYAQTVSWFIKDRFYILTNLKNVRVRANVHSWIVKFGTKWNISKVKELLGLNMESKGFGFKITGKLSDKTRILNAKIQFSFYDSMAFKVRHIVKMATTIVIKTSMLLRTKMVTTFSDQFLFLIEMCKGLKERVNITYDSTPIYLNGIFIISDIVKNKFDSNFGFAKGVHTMYAKLKFSIVDSMHFTILCTATLFKLKKLGYWDSFNLGEIDNELLGNMDGEIILE